MKWRDAYKERKARREAQQTYERWIDESEAVLAAAIPGCPRAPRPLPLVGTCEAIVIVDTIRALLAVVLDDDQGARDAMARAQEYFTSDV